jgi:hypothetical protein
MVVTGFFACQWMKHSGALRVPNFNVYTVPQFTNNLMTCLALVYVALSLTEAKTKWIFGPLQQGAFYLGALGFYALGDVEELNFSISGGTKAVVKKFNRTALLVFGSVAIGVTIIVALNACKGTLPKQRRPVTWGMIAICIAYLVSLWHWLLDTSITVAIHWHHAVLATIVLVLTRLLPISRDWSGTLLQVVGCVALGVIVQGMNAYGIGDLQFLKGNTGGPVSERAAKITTIVLGTVTAGGMATHFMTKRSPQVAVVAQQRYIQANPTRRPVEPAGLGLGLRAGLDW